MQSQLPFMESVSEYAFAEAPKGALGLKTTGMKALGKQGEAFLDALRGMTGEASLPSDAGPVVTTMLFDAGPVAVKVLSDAGPVAVQMPSEAGPAASVIDRAGGVTRSVVMTSVEEIDADNAIAAPGQPVDASTDLPPGFIVQAAEPAVFPTDETADELDDGLPSEPAVEKGEKPGGRPTPHTDARKAAAPPMNPSAGPGDTGTTEKAGGTKNGEAVDVPSRQPAETEAIQERTPTSGWLPHGLTLNRRDGATVDGTPAGREEKIGPMTAGQGSDAAPDGNLKNAVSANRQPSDERPGKTVLSFSPQASDQPASPGKGPDTRVWDPVRVPNDLGRVSNGHPLSGESAGNRQEPPAIPSVPDKGLVEGDRIHAIPMPRRGVVDDRKETQIAARYPVEGPKASGNVSAGSWAKTDLIQNNRSGDGASGPMIDGDNKTGPDFLTQPSLKRATGTNRSLEPASPPPVTGVTKKSPFMPPAAGSTAHSVEMKSDRETVSVQSAVDRQSSGRIPFSNPTGGENEEKGDGAQRGTPLFTPEKTGGRTTIPSHGGPKGKSTEPIATGFGSKNETDNSGDNDQGLFNKYALKPSGSTAGQKGPVQPALFSPGEVTPENAAAGETIRPEGPNFPDGTTAIHSPGTGKSEQTGPPATSGPAGKGADLPDFFPKIVNRAVMTLKGGQSEMKMVLKPESLGQVRMQVLTENQHVMVKIIAETQVVKETIESNLGQLKADLQSHGLEVDEFDVTTSQDSHRDEKNPRHLSGYRFGSRPGGRAAGDTPEGEGEIQVPRQGKLDDSGKVDFFA